MTLAEADHYAERAGYPTREEAEAQLRERHPDFIARYGPLSIGYQGGWQIRTPGGLRFFIDPSGLVSARCYREPDEWQPIGAEEHHA